MSVSEGFGPIAFVSSWAASVSGAGTSLLLREWREGTFPFPRVEVPNFPIIYRFTGRATVAKFSLASITASARQIGQWTLPRPVTEVTSGISSAITISSCL